MKNKNTYPVARPSTLPRSFWYSLIFAGIWMVVYSIWAISTPNMTASYQTIMGTGLSLSTLLNFGLSLVGIKKEHFKWKGVSTQQRLYTLVPLIFSLSLIGMFTGSILFALNELSFPSWVNAPFPSWADVPTLAEYPILLLGIFLFPIPTHFLSRVRRVGVLLDGLLIIIGLVTFSWFFLLGPMLLQGNKESMLAVIVHLAYPCGDLVLIGCVILLIIAVHEKSFRTIIGLISTSMLLFVLVDTNTQHEILQHSLSLGWTSLGWPIGNLLIALAAQMLRTLPDRQKTEVTTNHKHSTHSLSMWRSLLPYALVPATFALAFYVWDTQRSSAVAIGTYCCAIILLGLFFLKQIVAIQETHRLNQGLQQNRQTLQKQNSLLEVANTRLEALATTDPLTELPNHRALVTTISNEMERAQRYQRSCTLLFFDLDHFKALNDGYGHAIGDEILIAFSHLIRQHIRNIDIVGRWGGEEFLAILPETTQQEASVIAEQLREVVSQQTFNIGGGLHLTCSIGMASYPLHATDLNSLVNAADQAMYAAKRLGRNQVRQIDDPEVQLLLTGGNTEGDREQTSLQGFIKALISLMEQRTLDLGQHAYDVANLVEQLAIRLEVPVHEKQMMVLAGQLHDIGKIGIPDSILQKPARLTPDEWEVMKKHPTVGAEIVAHIPALRPLEPVIRAHHERWDGMGYPDQLREEAIPLAARIIAVADSYMAMTVERPYQLARTSEAALVELQRCAGTQFDPKVVETLATLLHEQVQERELELSIV
jgi:two-component system, cell cycle response regulator